MPIHSKLRELRKQLQISQGKLGVLSGVSLPTLQRLEAGHGNPSLEILESLARALGYQLELSPLPVSVDQLSYLGVPISAIREEPVPKTPESLILKLNLFVEKMVEADPKIVKAIQGTLLALRDHYPGQFERLNEKAKKLVSKDLNGEIIKLKRISLTKLSSYL